MKRLLLLLLPLNLIAAPSPIGPRVSQTLARTADLTNYIPSAYSTVRLMGYSAAGDAPAMDLVYDPASSVPTNGINVFMPVNGVGRLVGEWSGDARNAGVTGDGITDDQPAIQRALEAAAPIGIVVYLPGPADYMLRTGIVLRSNMRLRGDGKTTRLFKGFGPELAPGSGPSPKPRAAITTADAVYPSWGEAISVVSTNIEIRDFAVYGMDPYQGPLIYLDSFSHLVADNITVRSWEHQADWGFTVRGHHFNGSRLDIDTRGRVFNDGFHVVGGNDGVLVNSFVYSGDDALVLGSSRNQEIRRWNIANIIGGASHGHAIRIAQNTNTTSWPGTEVTTLIEAINFVNLNMFGGQFRNGIALIEEDWKQWDAGVQAPGNIRDIKVSNSFLYGGDIATHDGINPIGFRVQGVHGVTLDNVTISNSLRSSISGEGTKRFKAHGVTVYQNQSDSSGWPSVAFRQDISTNLLNQDIEFVGGSFTAKTNQSVFAFEGARDVRVIGASISNGVNAIAFTTECVNGIFANNFIAAALNGVNTVGAQCITSIGNRFTGVTNEYSGTPDQFTRLDHYLEVSRPDFGPIIKWSRSSTEGEIGIIGARNRLLTAAGLHLANVDGDDVTRLAQLSAFPYDISQTLVPPITNVVDGVTNIITTTNMPTLEIFRGAATQTENTLNIAGGTANKTAWMTTRVYAGTNVNSLMGKNVLTVTKDGLMVSDGSVAPNVDTTLIAEFGSTNRAVGLPVVLDPNRVTPYKDGAIQFNDTINRPEHYESGQWKAMSPYTIPIVNVGNVTLISNTTYYAGLAGGQLMQLSPTTLRIPMLKPGRVTGFFFRMRSATPGSGENLTVNVVADGVSLGGITGALDATTRDFQVTGLTNMAYTNVVMEILTPPSWSSPPANTSASGFIMIE